MITFSQHISLMQYYGELGGAIGTTTYIGQIGGGVKTYRSNFNIHYRKLLTNKFGVRINYEYLPFGANDSLSNQPAIQARGFQFYKTFHEFNFLLEYFFNNIRYINYENHFIPYVGIGMGYMLNEPTDNNNFDSYASIQQIFVNQFWPICTIPINVGFNYRLTNNINIFSEFSYRFTTSDLVDDFSAANQIITPSGTFKARNQGKDNLYSIKIGVSKSLFKVFGPDKMLKNYFDNFVIKYVYILSAEPAKTLQPTAYFN